MPSEGGVILASNHTVAIDPFLIQCACPRFVRWVMWDQFKLWVLWPLWWMTRPIEVSLDGSDGTRVRKMIKAVNRGDVLGLFPEGGLQRDRRELQEFEAGVAIVARRTGAPVVPVWISGTPRVKLMLWHVLLPCCAEVKFGKPFVVDGEMETEAALALIREKMLAVRDVAQET